MWVTAAGLQCCESHKAAWGKTLPVAPTLLYISTLALAYGACHILSHMLGHIRNIHNPLSLMSASAKDYELPVLVILADDMSAAFVVAPLLHWLRRTGLWQGAAVA